MSDPRVSLLIPCFNGAKTLPRLFESIRKQATPFAEIVVLDDASIDNSAEVASNLGARVIKSSTNLGPAKARNTLAESSTCDWLHFHDADDLLDDNYNLRLFRELDEKTDVVACDADWIREDGTVQIKWRYNDVKCQSNPLAYFLTNPLGINNCIYRRSTFMKSGGYDPALVPWEDADFHVRLAEMGVRFRMIPEVLTRSVRIASGISMDYSRNWLSRLRCLENYSERFDSSLHTELASEFERASFNLLLHAETNGARRAFEKSTEHGGTPPSTNSAVFRTLKHLLPGFFLLRLKVFLLKIRGNIRK